MENREGNPEGGPDRTEEVYQRWHREFEAELDRVLDDKHSDLDEVTKVIWEKGILDHVAPTDPEAIKARREKDKPVWNRDDPETYWRILYSAEATKQALEKMKSSGRNYITGPVTEAYGKILADPRVKDIFPNIDNEDPGITLSHKIIERARQELKDRGETPHDNLILPGSVGNFKEIPVTVAEITETGMVVLKPIREADTDRLTEATENEAHEISPKDLDKSRFVTDESETLE